MFWLRQSTKLRINNVIKALFYNWRDCMGIEPTRDATRLPTGFEDLGGHQHPNQPHRMKHAPLYRADETNLKQAEKVFE